LFSQAAAAEAAEAAEEVVAAEAFSATVEVVN
jgi:hypothetical protein